MKPLKLFELLVVSGGFLLYFGHSQMSRIQGGQLMISIILALLFDYKFRPIETNTFRTDDAGLWACVLVPTVLQITDPENCDLVTLLVPLSLLLYVQQTEQPVSRIFVSAGLLVYITFLCYLRKQAFSVIMCCLSVLYCYLVWYLPRWFRRSFTFGEVSMVTQLLFYFLYNCLKWLFVNKDYSIAEVLDILIGTMYIGVLAVMAILAQYRKVGVAGVGILVVIAASICIYVIFHLIGWKALYLMLKNLLWTHTSIVLLTWWLLCTLASVLLVMHYGAASTRKQLSTDQADMLYDKNNKTLDSATTDKTMIFTKHRPKNTKDISNTLKQSLEGNIRNSNTYDKLEKLKPSSIERIYQDKDEIQHNMMDKRKCKNKPGGQDRSSQCIEGERYMSSQTGNQTKNNSGNQIKTCSQTGNHGETRVSGSKYEVSQIPVYVRKYFHIAVLSVYLPGLLYHPQLLYLATTLAAGVMVIIEGVRVADIRRISPVLNQYLKVFLDKQDQGDLILTPIYLLLGCSLPLWLTHRKQGCVSMYAGLIAVGVGDSLASIVGRAYGRHKWPDSQKSFEGSMSAFLGQILTIVILGQLGVPGSSLSWPVVLSMLLSVCLEACSTQIDNLVVPMFTFMLLAATESKHRLPIT